MSTVYCSCVCCSVVCACMCVCVFACTRVLMYTIHTLALICSHIHTHILPAVAVSGIFLSSLMCSFSFTLFCWRKTSSCWRFSASLRQGAWDQSSVGEGEGLVRSGRNTIAKLLCRCYTFMQRLWSSQLLAQSTAHFDGSMLHAKNTLVRGSGYGIPLPSNLWSLRAHLLAIHISVSQGTN